MIFFTAVIAVIVKYMKNDLDITKFESAQKTTVELLSRFDWLSRRYDRSRVVEFNFSS